MSALEDDDDDDEAPTLVPYSATNDQAPCPVTILSGFLGAGKTTLIQYILRSPDHGKRIAVIENEFGGGNDGLSIESMIARDGLDPTNNSLQDLIELPNGCVCCTVKDSLVVTLETLLERRPDIDTILIECSGMANPGPIASLFWLDQALHSRLQLDGIVTVVDAVNIDQQLRDTFEAAQQIAYADRLLVNKVDRINNDNDLASLMQRIRRVGTTAPVQTTSYGVVPDLDWILNTKCYDTETTHARILEQQQQTDQHGHEHHHHGDKESCSTCQHTQYVSTVTLVRHDATIDVQKVHAWLAQVLWPQQEEHTSVLMELCKSTSDAPPPKKENDAKQVIYRIKGVLLTKDNKNEPCLHIVQAVHDLWEIEPAKNNKNSSPCSKLIVIGRHLNETELQKGFDQC